MSSSGETPLTDDQRLHELAQSELPGLALGETVAADLSGHIAGCARCTAELSALRGVIGAVRGSDGTDVPAFSAARRDAVWASIAAETQTAPAAAERPAPTSLDAARERRRPGPRIAPRMLLLAAALVLVAGLGGWLIGRDTSGTSTTASSAQAALSAQPGTAATARGTAVMSSSSHGLQMELKTSGLPAPDGYYEVWLYDPSANRMVAVGTLGTGAEGSFTLPAGIDTSVYRIVDVSDQRFNGDPRHQTSVLRGALTP